MSTGRLKHASGEKILISISKKRRKKYASRPHFCMNSGSSIRNSEKNQSKSVLAGGVIRWLVGTNQAFGVLQKLLSVYNLNSGCTIDLLHARRESSKVQPKHELDGEDRSANGQ